MDLLGRSCPKSVSAPRTQLLCNCLIAGTHFLICWPLPPLVSYVELVELVGCGLAPSPSRGTNPGRSEKIPSCFDKSYPELCVLHERRKRGATLALRPAHAGNIFTKPHLPIVKSLLEGQKRPRKAPHSLSLRLLASSDPTSCGGAKPSDRCTAKASVQPRDPDGRPRNPAPKQSDNGGSREPPGGDPTPHPIV